MSMFQCQNCGCAENTALTSGYLTFLHKDLDFVGIESRVGKRLCSACTPSNFVGGGVVDKGGQWHGRFPRRFLEKGAYVTNKEGNLAHCTTGELDYHKHSKDEEFK